MTEHRAHQGSQCRHAKLDEAIVTDIRRRYSLGDISQNKLAAEYGVERTTIRDIINRRTWKQVA